MNREPTSPPLATWEIFSACIHYLGKPALTSLFQRGERQIERWAANPDTAASHQRNPLDRVETLLRLLMEKDRRPITRNIVSRLAHIAGCELRDKEMPAPDKETLELEIIDDLPFKTRYDEILLDPESSQEECRNALDDLIRELKENYVRKCGDCGWEA